MTSIFRFVRAGFFGAVSSLLLASASAADYDLTIGAGNVGNQVYPTMFGTNVVYNRLEVSQWSTFLATFNALGMTTLRYSGGTVTEADFDFRDSNGPADDCISLSMFLQAVAQNDITPLLVMPTKRFRSNYATTGAQYAKDYVKAVNIDHGVSGGEQFGTTQTVAIWELGNEYYTDNEGGLPLDPTTYGKIANKFASAMKTIDASIIPVVQFRRSDIPAAGTIANQLTSGAVEACLTHTYPGSNESFTNLTSQIVAGASEFQLEPMITEWNLAGDAESGLVLANYLPRIFTAQVNAGVKISTQWPLMWRTNAVNTLLANTDGSLRPAGQIFQWLSQAATNRKVVATTTSNAVMQAVAFKDGPAHKLSILVLCGNSTANSQVAMTVNGFNGGVFNVTLGKRYSAATGFGGESDSAAAVLATVTPAKSGNTLFFTANKYSKHEVIRVDLSY